MDKDTFGLSKLIEVISKGMGRLTKAYFDRQDIKTDEIRLKTMAEARMAILDHLNVSKSPLLTDSELKLNLDGVEIKKNFNSSITTLPVIALDERSQNRVSYETAKKQLNIESITAIAANELRNEQEIDKAPVNGDWINRFFSYAQDISSEEMQLIWGKILAGEIKKTGSYSLRTIDIIRNLSSDEAKLITRVAKLTFEYTNMGYLFNGPRVLEKYSIFHIDIIILEEIGIVSDRQSMFPASLAESLNITVGNKVFVFHRSDKSKLRDTPVIILTKAGLEIIRLIQKDVEIDHDYLIEFGNYVTQLSGILTTADIDKWSPTGEHTVKNIKHERL